MHSNLALNQNWPGVPESRRTARVTGDGNAAKCRKIFGDVPHGGMGNRKLLKISVDGRSSCSTPTNFLNLFFKMCRAVLVNPCSVLLAAVVAVLAFSAPADAFVNCSNWKSRGPTGVNFWKNITPAEINTCVSRWSDLEMRDSNQQTVLHKALYGSSPEIVEILIKSGSNVNAKTSIGMTPLHLANWFCRLNDEEELLDKEVKSRLLTDAGADVNIQDKRGESPLHSAAAGCSVNTTTSLLDAGASVHMVNLSGQTPLHKAAELGNLDTVMQLLLAGSDPLSQDSRGKTPITLALSNRDIENREVILETLINATDRLNIECNRWQTSAFWQESTDDILVSCFSKWKDGIDTGVFGEHPLHFAAAKGRVGAVRLLLTSTNWSSNVLDGAQNTPLHWAALLGNEVSIQELIASDANPNAENMNGLTALHLATEREHMPNVNSLISAGANPNAKDAFGRTPLHFASGYYHNVNFVMVLIQAGADPNLRDVEGKSPLYIASEHILPATYGMEQRIMIETLIANGSSPNTRDNEGRSPLHNLAYLGDEDTIKLFTDAGAKTSARDRFGLTPLHLASRFGRDQGHLRVLALISAGANPNAQDTWGETPLHEAASSDRSTPEVIKILLAAGAVASIRNRDGKCPADLAEDNQIIRESEVYWELHDACFN